MTRRYPHAIRSQWRAMNCFPLRCGRKLIALCHMGTSFLGDRAVQFDFKCWQAISEVLTSLFSSPGRQIPWLCDGHRRLIPLHKAPLAGMKCTVRSINYYVNTSAATVNAPRKCTGSLKSEDMHTGRAGQTNTRLSSRRPLFVSRVHV